MSHMQHNCKLTPTERPTFKARRVQGLQRLVDGVARVEVFVDSMWLDPALVAAAAEASARLERISNQDFERWVASLSDKEDTQLLFRVARQEGAVAAELAGRFRYATTGHLRPPTIGVDPFRAREWLSP